MDWKLCFHKLGWRTPWKISEIWSVFKNWFPLISAAASTSRKKLSSKVDGFHYRKNPSPTAGNEGFVQKYVSTRWKKNFHWQESLKNIFLNMVCASQKIRLHYPEWSIRRKIHFHYTEKLLLLARKSKKMVYTSRKVFFFYNRFLLISIMVSNSRKKALNKSIRQKISFH